MFSHPWQKFSFANDRFYRWQWEDFGHVLSNVWIVAQNNFTDWNRDKAFGFLLVYNYFHLLSNILGGVVHIWEHRFCVKYSVCRTKHFSDSQEEQEAFWEKQDLSRETRGKKW